MAKSPPSFDFYPNDWLGDTRIMCPGAAGLYMHLLCWQWKYGHIPDTEEQRCQLIGQSQAIYRSLWEQVRHKFTQIDASELCDWDDKDRNKLVFVNLKLHEMRQDRLPAWVHNREVNRQNARKKRKKRGSSDSLANRLAIREDGSRKTEDVKKNIVSPDLPYPSQEFREAWYGYLEVRKLSKFTMTSRALNLLIGKLGKMAESDAIESLDAATVGKWKSVYVPSKSAELAEQESDARYKARRRKAQLEERAAIAARKAANRLQYDN